MKSMILLKSQVGLMHRQKWTQWNFLGTTEKLQRKQMTECETFAGVFPRYNL